MQYKKAYRQIEVTEGADGMVIKLGDKVHITKTPDMEEGYFVHIAYEAPQKITHHTLQAILLEYCCTSKALITEILSFYLPRVIFTCYLTNGLTVAVKRKMTKHEREVANKFAEEKTWGIWWWSSIEPDIDPNTSFFNPQDVKVLLNEEEQKRLNLC